MSRSGTRYRSVSVVVAGNRCTRRVAIPEMAERRWVQRAPLDVDVRCATPDLSFHGRAVNVSRTGIAFDRGGALALPPGLTVVTELTLPGDEAPVQLLGEVVRDQATSNGRRTAVAFHPSVRSATYPVAEFVARDR